MKTKIIKIENTNFWITKNHNLTIEQTNIPKSCGFKEVYWEIEIINYNKEKAEIFAKIINYKSNKINDFNNQEKKGKIRKITFENITNKIFDNLYRYKAIEFENYIRKDKYFSSPQKKISYDVNILKKEKYNLINVNIEKKISLYLKDVSIGFACVNFDTYIDEIGENIEFSIKNDYLEPNFDLIKYHFQKLLKTKKIEVDISLKIKDSETVLKEAKSEYINKIDNNFIEIIKYQRTLELIRQPKIEQVDKSLFTSQDIFNEIEENELGNIFEQNEKDILNLIVEKKRIRNRKQLEYLSGYLQSGKEVIRFSLKSKKSNFGFVFFIDKGKTKYHFVWELLDSHATYIWSIDKPADLKSLYKQIDNTINTIKTIGRKEYKFEYRNGLIDNNFDFDIITHENANSDFIDHFPKWKNKLDEKIV